MTRPRRKKKKKRKVTRTEISLESRHTLSTPGHFNARRHRWFETLYLAQWLPQAGMARSHAPFLLERVRAYKATSMVFVPVLGIPKDAFMWLCSGQSVFFVFFTQHHRPLSAGDDLKAKCKNEAKLVAFRDCDEWSQDWFFFFFNFRIQ